MRAVGSFRRFGCGDEMPTFWCRWCAHPEDVEFLPEECPRCAEPMRPTDWLDNLPLNHNDRRLLRSFGIAAEDVAITSNTVTDSD